MTTLPETEHDAPPQGPPTPPPSPWSAPRPEGPLAAALRLAQTQRAAGVPPGEAPHHSEPEALDHDIEALAREAQARQAVREALATALEWPEERRARRRARRARWMGWLALAGAVLLAALAAALAVSLAPADAASQSPAHSTGSDGLRLERQLSPAPGPGRETST